MTEPSNEIFIETQRIGSMLRVTAIDAATGTEVTFQAAASAKREHLSLIAANKLRYVMRKKGVLPDDR